MIFRTKKKPKRNLGRNVNRTVEQKNNSVFSYHANRYNVESVSNRSSSKTSNSKSNKISSYLYIVLGLIIITSCIYILVIDTQPKIIAISSSSADRVLLRDINEYRDKARYILDDNLFNKTKLTINTSAIEDEMKYNFPELNDVKVIIPIMGHRPVIQINAFVPVLVLNNDIGSFVVNNQGKAIIKLQDAKNINRLNVPYVNDQTKIDLKVGTKVLSSTEAQFIDKIYTQLSVKNISIESITIPPQANELDVKIKGTPYIIKFNTLLDPIQQVGTYFTIQEQIKKQKISVSRYVDLRVEERAYIQ